MALIIPSPGIIDISGKMAGNVFKRDKSGLHCVSMPRLLHKESTPAQHKQRAWYSGKKQEEHKNGPPPPGTNPPKTPGARGVYVITSLVSHRITSLGAPVWIPVGLIGGYPQSLQEWLITHGPEICNTFKIKMIDLEGIASRFMKIREFTYGQIAEEAALDTIADLTSLFGTALTRYLSGAVVTLAAMAIFYLVAELHDWLWPGMGYNNFPLGAVALMSNSSLSWGGLIARPSDNMLDFCSGGTTPCPFYSWGFYGGKSKHPDGSFELENMWETVESHLIYHYTYTWYLLKAWFIGYAYITNEGLYRFESDSYIQETFDKPVGWSTTRELALDYLNHITENWIRTSG
jgi:hypothetical protein